MKYIRLALLVVVISIISLFIQWLNIPLAFLFGSMIGTLIFLRFIQGELWFPKALGNSGVFIMGIQIGSSLTIPALIQMADDWYNIIIITLITLGLALLLSIPFRIMTNSTRETAILSSVPGALSQMLLMAEENKRANLLLVSLTQTSRIVFIVILVPFITHFFPEETVSSSNEVTHLTEIGNAFVLLIPIAGFILYLLLKNIHFPASLLLGPIIATVIWNLFVQESFSLDLPLIAIAQILFGIRIGLQIFTLVKQLSKRDVLAIMIQNLGLIFGTLLLVLVYITFSSHTFTSLFLSAAPGGLAQIIIIALESGGDVAMISSYHIFRIFFIILVVVPIVTYYLNNLKMKNS